MGYGALVSATAPALGLTYGGIVNQTLGWRYIFVLLVPVLIITLISIRLCSLQELQEPVFVRHWWQQRRCRIILSAMSKKRQQKNVICRYKLFDIEQKFRKIQIIVRWVFYMKVYFWTNDFYCCRGTSVIGRQAVL